MTREEREFEKKIINIKCKIMLLEKLVRALEDYIPIHYNDGGDDEMLKNVLSLSKDDLKQSRNNLMDLVENNDL